MASHTEDLGADGDRLFPRDEVSRIEITLCSEWYAVMWQEMEDALGRFGRSNQGLGALRGDEGPADERPPELGEDPTYVPATVHFEGRSWPYVGIRFKGNSSLATSWTEGIAKLPLRLDFDRFEATWPETEDQRFWGFDDFALTPPGSFDPSFLRNTLANEILESQDLPAPRNALYGVYVDVGEGFEYWGLYTAFESPADEPFLDRVYGSDHGTVYKPEEGCADWTCFDAGDFQQKRGDDTSLDDVRDALEALEALEAREESTEGAISDFETRFDVDTFLRWLATNTLMGNWDSYGSMAHNYYLYGDPAAWGQLTWIAWDHNQALLEDRVELLSLDLDEVDEDWPLIRRLLDISSYRQTYEAYLEQTQEGLLHPEAFQERATELQALVEPWVEAEQAPYTHLEEISSFRESITGSDGLVEWVEERAALLDGR